VDLLTGCEAKVSAGAKSLPVTCFQLAAFLAVPSVTIFTGNMGAGSVLPFIQLSIYLLIYLFFYLFSCSSIHSFIVRLHCEA